jgi:hypothetical protein
MKLATTLSLLVACAGSDTPLTDGGTDDAGQADGSGPPSDGGTIPSSSDAGVPGGCVWTAVPTGATIPSLADYAFAISSSGERAIAYTAMVGTRFDVVVARGTTTFTSTPYGFNLIADNAYTDISAAYTPTGVLRVAYNNERTSGYEGGVHYAPAPGTNVFIDGAGLLGSVGGTQIAIGPDGRAHIAYRKTQIGDHRIAVASMTNTTASITAAMIDDHLIDTEIAVDATNTIHITADDYSDPQRMVYARTTGIGGGWSPVATITPNEQSNGGNLVVDANQVVHAARLDRDRIIYARKPPSGAWQLAFTALSATSVPTGITHKDVAVDATGQLHLVWADRYGKLVYERIGQPPVTLQPTGDAVVHDVQLELGPTGPQIAFATAPSFSSAWALSITRCN